MCSGGVRAAMAAQVLIDGRYQGVGQRVVGARSRIHPAERKVLTVCQR
jgi:hypothetical protein